MVLRWKKVHSSHPAIQEQRTQATSTGHSSKCAADWIFAGNTSNLSQKACGKNMDPYEPINSNIFETTDSSLLGQEKKEKFSTCMAHVVFRFLLSTASQDLQIVTTILLPVVWNTNTQCFRSCKKLKKKNVAWFHPSVGYHVSLHFIGCILYDLKNKRDQLWLWMFRSSLKATVMGILLQGLKKKDPFWTLW